MNYPFKNCFMETSLHHFIIAAIGETVLIHWTTAGVIVEPDVLKILSHYLHLYMRVSVMLGETITQKHLFSCRFPHCRWFWSLTIHLWSYAYLIQAMRARWTGHQSLARVLRFTRLNPRWQNVQTKQDKPGFKPSTSLLWGNSANHHTTCHACWCLFLHIIFSSTDGNNKHLTA